MKLGKALLGALAACMALAGSPALATVYTYSLADHPDGTKSKNSPFHKYGLRLDYNDKFFSFGGDANATLTYDDMAMTAVISGTMVESLGNHNLGTDLWDVTYEITGLSDLGGGFFTGTMGSGSISFNGTMYDLGYEVNNQGLAFIFDDDGHRLGGHQPYPTDIVGRGWVIDKDIDKDCCNDFLFTATAVPLPAAAWLLLGGVGVLGATRRFGRKDT